MPKFFIKTNQIEENKIRIIGEDVKHITHVLRAKVGEKITLCNIDKGINYISVINKITSNFVLCDIISKQEGSSETKTKISIFQGLPKSDKMEYIIQKNVELGVEKIVPVIMKRCIVKLDGKDTIKKVERWQKIAKAAAKQSERDIIPDIEYPITVSKLCEKVSEFDLMLLAYENEEIDTLKNELKKMSSFQKMKIGVIIGPEGGIDKEEVEQLSKVGVKIVTLGKRILRTETASIVIVSNIIYEYEN